MNLLSPTDLQQKERLVAHRNKIESWRTELKLYPKEVNRVGHGLH